MADFSSSGIWRLDTGVMIDYDEMNLPGDLTQRFEDWIMFYDSECTGRPDYCVIAEMAQHLHERGRQLAKEIKRLFPLQTVEYWAELPRDDPERLMKTEITL